MEPDGLPTPDAPPETTEARWVASAKAGDSVAFGRLVRQYQRRAVGVAYRFLGNSADAADVAQEAFIRSHSRLDQLDDDARFGPWLMRIVANLALNYRRKRSSTAAVTLQVGMESGLVPSRLGGQTPSRWEDAEHDELSGELKQAVDQAIAQLPEKQAATLILFSVEGMPQKEVARILDCSVELVKWNVFQARKKLKEMLSDFL